MIFALGKSSGLGAYSETMTLFLKSYSVHLHYLLLLNIFELFSFIETSKRARALHRDKKYMTVTQ
jgi:hypothetical protein